MKRLMCLLLVGLTFANVVDSQPPIPKTPFELYSHELPYTPKQGKIVVSFMIDENGKVEEPEEKLKITKMAWETKGVRSVKNAITIKGQTNFKSTAKDILITSQLRTALILNKKTKARNYTLETVNKNIYIFGIAMDEEEKKEVINEANKIFDVEEVIPSIYLATELSRSKL